MWFIRIRGRFLTYSNASDRGYEEMSIGKLMCRRISRRFTNGLVLVVPTSRSSRLKESGGTGPRMSKENPAFSITA